jgi:hypothetical protein
MPHDSQPPREAWALPSFAEADPAVGTAMPERVAKARSAAEPQPPDPQPVPHR